MLVVGLADTYGLVAYFEKEKITEEVRTDLFVRAGDGMYKDACYFEADVKDAAHSDIMKNVKTGEYRKALLELKNNCNRLWLPKKDVSKAIWSKIPA